MMTLAERRLGNFEATFWPKFGRTNDWDGAREMVRLLIAKQKPQLTIIETSAFSQDYSKQLDTEVWDFMFSRWGAWVESCCRNTTEMRFIRKKCPNVKIGIMGAEEFLSEEASLWKADMLFCSPASDTTISRELELAYDEMPKKSFIVVGDCTGDRAKMAREFLTERQATFVLDGPVSIWEKIDG